MKKFALFLAAGAVALSAAQAWAADKVTLQLKWVTQAQFAGYYVAKDKGFYKEENLDVEIKPGGPDIAPAQVLAGGGADVVLDWMPSALATREKGVPLVNIAQPFKSSGMMLRQAPSAARCSWFYILPIRIARSLYSRPVRCCTLIDDPALWSSQHIYSNQ